VSRVRQLCAILAAVLAVGAPQALAADPVGAAAQDVARPASGVLAGLSLDRTTEDRLLALDPERVSPEEVREVLARAPAPRIIGLQGSVPIVTMAPFAEFLIAMGYPAERLRNPRDGRYTYSSFTDSREIAGALAWHYEREGSVPMLIGHSQGGMLTVKVLQDLAGASGDRIHVWNPVTNTAEDRFTIVDPLTGADRSVVGLRVPYAAALATGSLMRVLLGQWGMLSRLRTVPDTVNEFTGYFIEWDVIAGTSPGSAQDNPYRPTGSAKVRNVTLPAEYSHLALPAAEHLAAQKVTRAWIERYTPGEQSPAQTDLDTQNLLHAADIWFSIKKHWCLYAQSLVRAQRAVLQARR
jgi:hypothetical protein